MITLTIKIRYNFIPAQHHKVKQHTQFHTITEQTTADGEIVGS